MTRDSDHTSSPLIIAHRGASADAPENTLAAVRLAWDICVEAVEIDVVTTRDGRVVVIHDDDTLRTTGVFHSVRDTDAAVLRELDAGRFKDARFTGERIPFLSEILDSVPSGKRLVVEIKGGPEEAQPVANIVGAHPARDAVTFICFDTSTLDAIHDLLPDRPVLQLVDAELLLSAGGPEGILAMVSAHGFHGIDVDYKVITPGLVSAAERAGLTLWCWAVNDPAEAHRLACMGVAGITTNRPGLLREE